MVTVRFMRTAMWLAYPVAEILLLLWVADRIGWGWTAMLLGMGLFAGVVVMRWAGAKAFRALADPRMRGEAFSVRAADGTEQTVIAPPQPGAEQEAGRALGGSALLFLAGILLATPGFLSDAAGLLLLLPPVRAAVGRMLARSMRSATVTTSGVTVVRMDMRRLPPAPPNDNGPSR